MASSLIRPGVAILSREAARLRALDPPMEDPAVHAFVGLFDPIVELGRQRLALGPSERSQGQQLELLIFALVDEQAAAARRQGLGACAVGFTQALETRG